jgi:LacI family transcriptional regulator
LPSGARGAKELAMPTTARSVITIKEVAAHAEVSIATVSYALRGHAKISLATRERVRQSAEALGYRPNPRVAGLMAHIRRAHGPSVGERIAFVWVHTTREECRSDPFLGSVLSGARQRAEQLGYALEEFWTEQPGMTDRRLSAILRSRGITGVVFSPVMHEVAVRLDFDWPRFASAVIGHARWVPELHHSGHHHYHAMSATLEEAARLGLRRPAVILNPEANERGRRAWHAAFLAFHPLPDEAPLLALPALPPNAAALRQWVGLRRPDVLILHRSDMVRQVRAWLPARERPFLACLHWSPDIAELPGIDQRFDLVAANAVDLVVGQLIANELGVPEVPRVTLFPGHWVDGRPGTPVAETTAPSAGVRSPAVAPRPRRGGG